MRDANGQEVKRLTLTTDSLGSASAQIVLPEGRMGGRYSLLTDNRQGGNTYIIVDEYKRPTFEVEFDKYEGAYANGDTITVKGRAKSYAGVPVQGAKVSYAITRGKAWWCRW